MTWRSTLTMENLQAFAYGQEFYDQMTLEFSKSPRLTTVEEVQAHVASFLNIYTCLNYHNYIISYPALPQSTTTWHKE